MCFFFKYCIPLKLLYCRPLFVQAASYEAVRLVTLPFSSCSKAYLIIKHRILRTSNIRNHINVQLGQINIYCYLN